MKTVAMLMVVVIMACAGCSDANKEKSQPLVDALERYSADSSGPDADKDWSSVEVAFETWNRDVKDDARESNRELWQAHICFAIAGIENDPNKAGTKLQSAKKILSHARDLFDKGE